MNYASMSKKELKEQIVNTTGTIRTLIIYDWYRTRKMEKEMDRLQMERFNEVSQVVSKHSLFGMPPDWNYENWRKASGYRIEQANNVTTDAFGRELHLPEAVMNQIPHDPSANISIAMLGPGRVTISATFAGARYWPGVAKNINSLLSHKEYQSEQD